MRETIGFNKRGSHFILSFLSDGVPSSNVFQIKQLLHSVNSIVSAKCKQTLYISVERHLI